MTDFSGSGSRRVFAERLLREARLQASTSTVNLATSIAALPVGTLVATDRLPALSAGGSGKTLTPANFLAYILPDADKGDITTSASGATWTIDAGAVSYAKIQDVSAASRLLGRGSAAGSGDVEELTLGSGLTLTGTVLSASGGSGDVVGPASATDNAVARFDLATGKLIKDSPLTVTDTTLTFDQVGGDGLFTVTLNDAFGPSLSGSGSSALAGVRVDSPFYAVGGVANYASLRATATPNSGGVWWAAYCEATTLHNSGTIVAIKGLYSNVTAFVAGGTTTEAIAVQADVDRSLGTLVTGVAVSVDAITDTMTNAYGLRIGNVTGGSSLNYAIYTGTGLVRFGDVVNTTESYQVDGVKVVGNQGATISDPTGGTVQDSEARTAINDIIDRLQAHGLIA